LESLSQKEKWFPWFISEWEREGSAGVVGAGSEDGGDAAGMSDNWQSAAKNEGYG